MNGSLNQWLIRFVKMCKIYKYEIYFALILNFSAINCILIGFIMQSFIALHHVCN